MIPLIFSERPQEQHVEICNLKRSETFEPSIVMTEIGRLYPAELRNILFLFLFNETVIQHL